MHFGRSYFSHHSTTEKSIDSVDFNKQYINHTERKYTHDSQPEMAITFFAINRFEHLTKRIHQ